MKLRHSLNVYVVCSCMNTLYSVFTRKYYMYLSYLCFSMMMMDHIGLTHV